MTTRSLFSLAVRIIGLISLIYCINSLIGLIGIDIPWQLIIKEVIWFLFSIWMLRGAPLIVRFSYGDGE
jgi:hypothetical protein